MYTDEYERLHKEYVVKLVEYYSAYQSYIYGRRSKQGNLKMRLLLKEMLALNKALIKESFATGRKKIEAYSHTYQSQRERSGDASRFHKHNVDSSEEGS